MGGQNAGGEYYKKSDQHMLAIPYNNTSWILRVNYVEDETYIIQSLKKLSDMFQIQMF